MKKCISVLLAGLTLPVSLVSVAQTDLTSVINTMPGVLARVTGESSEVTDETSQITDEGSSQTTDESSPVADESSSPTTGETDQTTDEVLQGTAVVQPDAKWPFLAAVYHKYNRWGDAPNGRACSATFIGGRYLLTTGRCGASLNEMQDYAVVGINDLTTAVTEAQKIAIRHVYVHENYQALFPLSDGFAKPRRNDIAIIELDEQIAGTPVALASEALTDSLSPGDNLSVPGWRNASIHGYTDSETLNKADLPYTDRSTCQNIGGNYNYIGDDAICAGEISDVTDSCTGDFGSPLLVDHDGTLTQVGITSWGNECSDTDPYGVYTNIANFRDWIKARTSRVNYSQKAISYSVNKRTLINIPVRNESEETFSITDFDLPEGVTVYYNQCTEALAQNNSCTVVIRVDREKAGLKADEWGTELKMAIETTHSLSPVLPVTLHFNNDYDADDTFDPGMNPSEYPGEY